MAKAIEPVKEQSYLPVTRGMDAITELFDATLGGDQLTPADLDRAINPSGKGSKQGWTIPSVDGDETTTTEIEGVIVYARTIRLYWEKKYSGDGVPPDCYSDNGIAGVGVAADKCAGRCMDCEFSKFGSGENNSQKCKQVKQLFILQPGELLPTIINCSPVNYNEAKRYSLRLLSKKQLGLHEVQTKLIMTSDKSKSGFEYGKVSFGMTKVLTDDAKEAMKAYRAMLVPLVSSFSAVATAAEELQDREPGSDDEVIEATATQVASDDDLDF